MRANRTGSRRHRRGNVIVFAAFMMIGMMAVLAMAVDIGYLLTAHTELQRSADAAAMAAAWQLVDDNSAAAMENARTVAAHYAGLNIVCRAAPTLVLGDNDSDDSDVRVGYLADSNSPMVYNDASLYNAVRVRVQRSEAQNGMVPLFFARALGHHSRGMTAEATAAIHRNIMGFRVPLGGGNLPIMPFAFDEETWLKMINYGIGGDDWAWDPDVQSVVPGSDGVLEGNLFPQPTGVPGNRGTVNIGSNNNSTATTSRQILHGITPEDLAYHGGSLQFDENGVLLLSGNPGISAGMKDELETIIGKPRIIPIFRHISPDPGNNAVYTIVGFAGVRVLEVNLTGANETKRVMIQPANVASAGTIPSTEEQMSYFIYSRPMLVQ